ncbi:MAG: hypothetical protein ACRC78_03950 [Planktothrix sp.]
MPLIPSTWTGQETVNAVGVGGGGFPVYQFAKSLNLTITELNTFIDLIGVSAESVNREVALDLISGSVQLFFKTLIGDYELITKENLTFDAVNNFVDATLGQLGLAVKCSEITELFLVLRWDKDVIFSTYTYTGTYPGTGEDELMINPKVRLLLPTGQNYPDGENVDAYDVGINSNLYQNNLQKLKNSNSGVDGYKLFDIYSFYPGKPITFNVVITDPDYSVYGNIAFQMLDPLDVAQAAMDVAADIVNLENRNVPNAFIGNLTRNALYKNVINNQAVIYPDFSRHVGRIVAQDMDNSNYYDTVIIESYTPNTNPLLGGTFTLTGQF